MHISNIKINGLYSFNSIINNKGIIEYFDIKLKEHENIIVGTNGSGKTNFIEIINNIIHSLITQNINNIYANNMSEREINHVELNIEFTETEAKLLHESYIFFKLNTFFKKGIKYDDILKITLEMNIFKINMNDVTNIKYGVKILWKQNFKTCLKYNSCTCCNTYFNDSHYNDDCLLKNINDIFAMHFTIAAYQNNNLPHNITNSCYAVNFVNYFGNNIEEIVKKNFYCNDKFEILNNIANQNYDDKYNELLTSIIKYTNKNNTNITFLKIINDKLNFNNCLENIKNEKQNLLNFSDIINKYIIGKLSYVSQKKYNHSCEIIHHLNDYETQITENNSVENIKNNYNHLTIFIEKINDKYSTHKKLFEIKNNDALIYKNIQDKFLEIMNKNFDIVLVVKNNITDYMYVINYNINKYYNCSCGESELIDFLVQYYDDNINIIIIDEPCVHIASQNKFKIATLFNKPNKQLIIVTHDVELINQEHNLIYFKLHNSITKVKQINLNILNKRYIFDNPEILFTDKILFVEGHHDYRVFNNYLKYIYNNVSPYKIIMLDGCGNKIYKFAAELEIDYKIIYDFDKINHNKTEKVNIIDVINLLSDYDNEFSNINVNINVNVDDILKSFDNKYNLNNNLNNKSPYEIMLYYDVINNVIYDGKLKHINYEQDDLKFYKFDRNDVQSSYEKQCIHNIIKKITDFAFNEFSNCQCDNSEHNIVIYKNKINDIYINRYAKFYSESNHNNSIKHKLEKYILAKAKNDADVYNNKYISSDNIINNYLPKEIFIWKYDIKDLEGIAKKIFGDNFSKKAWKYKSNEDIYNGIIKFNNQYPFNELKIFLNK